MAIKKTVGFLIIYIILDAIISNHSFAQREERVEKELTYQENKRKEEDRLFRQLALDAAFNQALLKFPVQEPQPAEERESLLMKISKIVKISGTLTNSLTYDDNVFLKRKRKDKKGDMIYELHPAISLNTTGSKNYLKLNYDYISRWYIKSGLRNRDHGVKFETHLEPSPVAGFTLGDNYTRTHDVDLSGVGLDKLNLSRSRVDVNTVSFDTNYKFNEKNVFSAGLKDSTTKDFNNPASNNHGQSVKLTWDNILTGVTTLSLNYGFSAIDYKAADKDSDEHAGGLSLKYKLTPITTPFIDYSHRTVLYEKETSDYQEHGINPGLSWRISPITSASVGYKYRTSLSRDSASNFISNGITLGLNHKSSPITDLESSLLYGYIKYRNGDNDKDIAADIKLNHKLSDFTEMSLKYKYGIEGTVNSDYLRYYVSLFSFNLKHKFVSRLTADFSASYERDLYRKRDLLTASSSIDDETRDRYTLGLGLSYSLTRWASLGATYAHSNIMSDFANETYRDNKYTCNFKMTF